LPNTKNQHESASNTGGTSTTTKKATIEKLGFNKMQASRFETLAEHPELIYNLVTPVVLGQQQNKKQ